ncbi:MAG TPA: hypothetical protein VJJ24_03070 [Candidatus Paceibacterota bacterium]
MPTTKNRINITVSREVEDAIERLARRDHVPEATKASELLRLAIELEEDIVLGEIVTRRDTSKTKFVSHKKAWKNFK